MPSSSALDVYGNVNQDLQTYQQSLAAVAADQNQVADPYPCALAAASTQVTSAPGTFRCGVSLPEELCRE